MSEILHSIEVLLERCEGRLACMRACPTEAIRVRNGKVRINPLLCIDCGECITACRQGAIRARSDNLERIQLYPYKVAVPSPTLFGQFPLTVTPADVIRGLLDIGFDEVWDVSIEAELVGRAIKDYLADYNGPRPLISSMCPVVVRLIQVSYPEMVKQIIPIQPPREIAGRELKKRISVEKGIPESDIGAIYISPCPAKIVSVIQPAEGVKSYLDVGISIHDIYNTLLTAITKAKRSKGGDSPSPVEPIKSKFWLNLSITGGLCLKLKEYRYISIAQLPNIIRLFEDIQKGKIKNVDFLECNACTGGCIGGPLTVDDAFVARSKMYKLIEAVGTDPEELERIVSERYVKGDYNIRAPLEPRVIERKSISIQEKIERMKLQEKLIDLLPGIDCGLCGVPRCELFAEDVAHGEAEMNDCVLIDPERVKILKELYLGEKG